MYIYIYVYIYVYISTFVCAHCIFVYRLKMNRGLVLIINIGGYVSEVSDTIAYSCDQDWLLLRRHEIGVFVSMSISCRYAC